VTVTECNCTEFVKPEGKMQNRWVKNEMDGAQKDFRNMGLDKWKTTAQELNCSRTFFGLGQYTQSVVVQIILVIK
jgi:hypothetical protein